jgi:alpha-galactosidase
MAIVRPESNDGLLVATEAPDSLKRMEILSKPKRITLLYNNSEETIFEYALEPGEAFESDCGFLLPFSGKWQDAVDGPYQRFIREKLAVCKVEDVPTFTLNTWETFYNDISEEIVVENIRMPVRWAFMPIS